MKPHKPTELMQTWAEDLIKQLPETHDGRNSWLLNYGTKPEQPEKQWMYVYNNTLEGKSWISPVTPDYYRGVIDIVYMGKIEVFK